MLNPPEGMTRPGSPFVMLYLYEMLESKGYFDEIISHIQESYEAMIMADASTVWEQFDSGIAHNPNGFPTRSHCHAWSSSPLHFLNRIILGIVPVGIGCKCYCVSPRINFHAWAQGATATLFGPIRVSWRKTTTTLELKIEAPDEVAGDALHAVRWGKGIAHATPLFIPKVGDNFCSQSVCLLV